MQADFVAEREELDFVYESSQSVYGDEFALFMKLGKCCFLYVLRVVGCRGSSRRRGGAQ